MIRINSFLSITSDVFTARQISELLGVKADNEVVKGRERTPPRNVPLRHGWNISREFNEIVSLDDAISIILNRVSSSIDEINELVSSGSAEVSVKISVVFPRDEFPLYVSSSNIARLESIKSSLDIEFFRA